MMKEKFTALISAATAFRARLEAIDAERATPFHVTGLDRAPGPLRSLRDLAQAAEALAEELGGYLAEPDGSRFKESAQAALDELLLADPRLPADFMMALGELRALSDAVWAQIDAQVRAGEFAVGFDADDDSGDALEPGKPRVIAKAGSQIKTLLDTPEFQALLAKVRAVAP